MPETYDVIIIGGGPNGLTCATYLGRAGLNVLLLDKKHELGGGMYTEDYGTPFRFNGHATYMMMAEYMPPHQDFDLPGRGIRYIRPEVQNAFVYPDDAALVLYTDLARSVESVGQLSPSDADTFERMYREFTDMTQQIIIPWHYQPPLPRDEQLQLLNETVLGRQLAEIYDWSPRESVESYEFKDPRVAGAVLHLATIWGLHPEGQGVGFMVPFFVTRMSNAALVKGGTHSLASALYGSAIKNGGEIGEWSEVSEIIVDQGAARGVRLEDGTEYRASAVVSTLPPDITFLGFVGQEHLPEDLAALARKWEWEEFSLFTAHIGIKGEPPRYSADGFNQDVNSALLNHMGIASPDDVVRHFQEIEGGQLPEPVGNVTCTSLHDPLQSSDGPYGPLHTLRWEGACPYALNGQHWDEVKEAYAKRCLEKWTEYAPSIAEATLLHRFVFSPLDIERRFTNMRRGNIKHGAYTPNQMGAARPHEECSGYRTPLEGLYVGGASTHPGGMITLGPGYNAAKVVVEDLGADLWWSPPAHVQHAREHGFLPTP